MGSCSNGADEVKRLMSTSASSRSKRKKQLQQGATATNLSEVEPCCSKGVYLSRLVTLLVPERRLSVYFRAHQLSLLYATGYLKG